MSPETNKRKKKHRLLKTLPIIFIVLTIVGFGLYILPHWINFREAVRYEPTEKLTNNPTGYMSLDESLRNAYKRLTLSLEENETEIDLEGFNVPLSKIETVIEAVMRDHPEFFWLDSYQCAYAPDSELVVSLSIQSNCSDEERKQKQILIDQAVSNIEAKISPDMDDYEKVKTVHDAIIQNTSYGYESKDHQNICSVFIDHQSVCAGYSKAFQYVLSDLGIFATTITGKGKDMDHAWNLVLLNNAFYYFDITWDDPSFENESPNGSVDIMYDFFAITTEEMLKDHIPDACFKNLPPCTSNADNYFMREGRFYTSPYGYVADLILALRQDGTIFRGKLSHPDELEQTISAIQWSAVLTSFSYIKNESLGILTICP